MTFCCHPLWLQEENDLINTLIAGAQKQSIECATTGKGRAIMV